LVRKPTRLSLYGRLSSGGGVSLRVARVRTITLFCDDMTTRTDKKQERTSRVSPSRQFEFLHRPSGHRFGLARPKAAQKIVAAWPVAKQDDEMRKAAKAKGKSNLPNQSNDDSNTAAHGIYTTQ
jgi:hypothetical protein